MGVWVVGWVSGSMGGSSQMTWVIQFCLKIYDLVTHDWLGGSMGGVKVK